ncbi:MAG: hypothetical protein NTV43_17160 [Methylococcales bacterium]|nr:hypothetical protein [Methylococcales bacterium]
MKRTPKQTQLDQVKAALLNRTPVNSIDMFNARITRLSSIIKRLRERGYPVITTRQGSNGLAHYTLPEGWQPPPHL